MAIWNDGSSGGPFAARSLDCGAKGKLLSVNFIHHEMIDKNQIDRNKIIWLRIKHWQYYVSRLTTNISKQLLHPVADIIIGIQ